MGASRLLMVMLLALALASCHRAVGDKVDCEAFNWFGNCALNYKDTHGHFPPAVVLDENGRRMHSWRVLLVPFVEANAFTSAYEVDAAWNDPANADLADGRRRVESEKFSGDPASARLVYQPHLTELSERDFTTGFLMVLRGDEPLAESEVPSRRPEGKEWQASAASNPDELIIVQVRKSDVHWMEPREIVLASPAPEWGVAFDDVRDEIVGSVLVSGDRVTCNDRDATLRLLDTRKSRVQRRAAGQ